MGLKFNSLFDPNLHESISYQASETVPEDHIIQTIRIYRLNGLIRAQMSLFLVELISNQNESMSKADYYELLGVDREFQMKL